MRRFISIAMLTAIVFAAAPVRADGHGDLGGECKDGLCGTPSQVLASSAVAECPGGLCGTPNLPPPSIWEQLLTWLGLD